MAQDMTCRYSPELAPAKGSQRNAQAAPQTSRYRSRAKVTLLFACCLILCIGAVGLRAVGPTVNGHASGGGFPFTGVILFVCILAIATVLRVVHHAENRLRSDTPVAQAYMRADPSGAAPTSTDGSSRPSGLPGRARSRSGARTARRAAAAPRLPASPY